MQINITNSWTLPGLGYPVFYRYFRDKITWYEADAVCQFHHANLATGKANFNLLLFLRVVHALLCLAFTIMECSFLSLLISQGRVFSLWVCMLLCLLQP